MKIFVIAGGMIAIPTLEQLIQAKLITGIGLPDLSNQYIDQLQQMAKQAKLPLVSLKRKSLKRELDKVLAKQKPDVVLVLTFPYKIPASVLKIPRFGFLNYHCAQLPEYRGGQPTFWEIKNQESHSAVTIHQMDAEFDTGPIVYQEKVPIAPHFTHGMLTISLSYMAVKATQMLLMQLQMGFLNKKAQDKTKGKYWPKPTKKDFIINWQTQSAAQIIALIKATNPSYQGALTQIQGMEISILSATLISYTTDKKGKPGQIVSLTEQDGLCVACVDDQLIKIEIVSLQEGVILGHQLAQLGIQVGASFQTSPI